MKSKLIIMLTHNDQTVKNALEVFESVKDLPVECWGFKDVGLPQPQMKELVSAMQAAGKKTFLEIVSYSEKACMEGAQLAVECGFDYLLGTLFFPSVWEYLKDKPIKYMPFVGKVSGSPSVLEGSCEEMLSEFKSFVDQGVYGCDLLAYRHVKDGEGLARAFVAGSTAPTVIAGSVSSPERIKVMSEVNPWAFTMGSALFTSAFVREGSFRENLTKVIEIMNTLP